MKAFYKMKLKILIFILIVGMVSAQDSCTRPYNRIGDLCCPDYNNDMMCDLHPTSTTMPTIIILNETHIIDIITNTTSSVNPDQIKKIEDINQKNQILGLPPITINPPRVILTTTTINIKTQSKSTSTIVTIHTTTTQKEYKSSNRITPMPIEESLIEKYKYHIGASIIIIVIIFTLFLYFIGDDEE